MFPLILKNKFLPPSFPSEWNCHSQWDCCPFRPLTALFQYLLTLWTFFWVAYFQFTFFIQLFIHSWNTSWAGLSQVTRHFLPGVLIMHGYLFPLPCLPSTGSHTHPCPFQGQVSPALLVPSLHFLNPHSPLSPLSLSFLLNFTLFRASLVAQAVKDACHAGDLDLIPWLGASPGEGNSYPLSILA